MTHRTRAENILAALDYSDYSCLLAVIHKERRAHILVEMLRGLGDHRKVLPAANLEGMCRLVADRYLLVYPECDHWWDPACKVWRPVDGAKEPEDLRFISTDWSDP